MKAVDISSIADNILIKPMDIENYADWRLKQNYNIVFKKNVFWKITHRGFYEPLHLLQKLEVSQINYHSIKSWGVRAALEKKDWPSANGSMTYYTIKDFKDLSYSSFSKNRRKNLRKCFSRIEIKEIRDKHIFYEQGYEIVKSNYLRTQYNNNIPSREQYLKGCGAFINSGNNGHLVLGAFIDKQLMGYLEMFAVKDTAYLSNIILSTDGLKHCTSPGLYYTAYIICQRSEKIKEIYAGQPNPRDRDLCIFKQSMKQTLQKIPSLSKIRFPVNAIIRLKSPHSYYRLMGK